MIVGITIFNSHLYFLGGFLFKKHSLQFVGNEGIYSMSKNLVKQNTTFCQTETFAGPSRVSSSSETVAKMTI